MVRILTTRLPAASAGKNYITSVNYQDSYKIKLHHTAMPIEKIYLNIFAHSPQWINTLLALRNKIVGVFGLDTYKDPGEFTLQNLKVGEKTGLFKIYSMEEHEIIAGEDDKHLNFRVSVLKQDDELFISTLVHYNNHFGKLYMAIIRPFHRAITKAILRNASKNKRI